MGSDTGSDSWYSGKEEVGGRMEYPGSSVAMFSHISFCFQLRLVCLLVDSLGYGEEGGGQDVLP